jgi:2-iminobutanoate/2-iminopropanoate deaminase
MTDASGSAPRAGFYSPIVSVGDWLILSGQLGAVAGRAGSPQLVEGGVEAQLRQALANASSLLESKGSDLAAVVKATVFLADMGDFAVMNRVWSETFGEPPPARSAIGVAALPLGAAIEVELWAWVGSRS